MQILNRLLVKTDNDNKHYETPAQRQAEVEKKYDVLRNYNSFQIGSTVAVQGDDGGPWDSSRQKR